MSQAGRTPDRDAEDVVISIAANQSSTARTWAFLVEVIVYESAQRFGSCLAFFFFFSSLHCLCFKAASAHFRPRPNPLDALLVSADRSSSVRIGGEVSPAPLGSPQVNLNLGRGRRCIFFIIIIIISISRHFVVVGNRKSQAGKKSFMHMLRFGASADLLRKRKNLFTVQMQWIKVSILNEINFRCLHFWS